METRLLLWVDADNNKYATVQNKKACAAQGSSQPEDNNWRRE